MFFQLCSGSATQLVPAWSRSQLFGESKQIVHNSHTHRDRPAFCFTSVVTTYAPDVTECLISRDFSVLRRPRAASHLRDAWKENGTSSRGVNQAGWVSFPSHHKPWQAMIGTSSTMAAPSRRTNPATASQTPRPVWLFLARFVASCPEPQSAWNPLR
jgi:hypothetical protein